MTRLLHLAMALLATVAAAELQTAAIYIQPVPTSGDALLSSSSSSSSSATVAPALLAEISYDPASDSDTAEVTAYEHPDLPSWGAEQLVRIGVFDAAAQAWTSATSVASAENFAKGYSPHFALRVAGDGTRVVAAAVKGVRVDAGATRDFGPQALLVRPEMAPQPALNRPVVVGRDGAGRAGEVEEKTFLQKYWWALALVAFFMITGGGPDK